MTEPFDDNLSMHSHAIDLPRRQLDRDSLFLQAGLHFIDGEDCGQVRVRNLSAGGLMAEAPINAKRGDKVEIELRNIGTVGGYVAWVAQGRFGIAFDHPIDPKLARRPVGQQHSSLPTFLKPPKTKTLGFHLKPKNR